MDYKLSETITLIKESELSYSQISEKCEVSKGWISQVVNGIIEDPSIRKIERIYLFLFFFREIKADIKTNQQKPKD